MLASLRENWFKRLNRLVRLGETNDTVSERYTCILTYAFIDYLWHFVKKVTHLWYFSTYCRNVTAVCTSLRFAKNKRLMDISNDLSKNVSQPYPGWKSIGARWIGTWSASLNSRQARRMAATWNRRAWQIRRCKQIKRNVLGWSVIFDRVWPKNVPWNRLLETILWLLSTRATAASSSWHDHSVDCVYQMPRRLPRFLQRLPKYRLDKSLRGRIIVSRATKKIWIKLYDFDSIVL